MLPLPLVPVKVASVMALAAPLANTVFAGMTAAGAVDSAKTLITPKKTLRKQMGVPEPGKEAGTLGSLSRSFDSVAPITRGVGDIGRGLVGLGTLGFVGQQYARAKAKDAREQDMHDAAVARIPNAPLFDLSRNVTAIDPMQYAGIQALPDLKTASLSLSFQI